MMVFSLHRVLPAFLPLFVVVAASDAVYRPARVKYDDLTTSDAWVETLRTEGIVSIQHVVLRNNKVTALHALSSCIQKSKSAQDLLLEDGTVRTTLAGHAQGSVISSLDANGACPELPVTEEFRSFVGETSVLVANRLMEVLDLKTPLLKDHASEEYDLAKIVSHGEHLEHFHVYKKPQDNESNRTIEWHVDQGLFLLFTPGLINGETTNDFYIQRPDGSTAQVEFHAENDDLVLLLGDGVNQYVNNQGLERPLRAVPHTLRMFPTTEAAPRMWYGRMVLPPPQSIHPTHGETFGSIRDGMLTGSLLGCSSTMKARELQDVTCDPDTAMFCWHRCMNFTDYDVSIDSCAADGLDLACANDDGALWNNKHDSQFKLACVDLETAEVFSGHPSLFLGVWTVLTAFVVLSVL